MKWSELEDDPCPVARGLSVVGDRWTLLVLRDCFRGLKRFDDIQQSLGITRHVLSDRLKRLEETGVLERHRYCEAPPRYEYRLTGKGRALYPVLVSLVTWAEAHQPHATAAPFLYRDRESGRPLDPVLVDRASGEALDPARVRAGRDEALSRND